MSRRPAKEEARTTWTPLCSHQRNRQRECQQHIKPSTKGDLLLLRTDVHTANGTYKEFYGGDGLPQFVKRGLRFHTKDHKGDVNTDQAEQRRLCQQGRFHHNKHPALILRGERVAWFGGGCRSEAGSRGARQVRSNGVIHANTHHVRGTLQVLRRKRSNSTAKLAAGPHQEQQAKVSDR